MKRWCKRIGIGVVVLGVLIVAGVLALPPHPHQIKTVKDPWLLPDGIAIPAGVSYERHVVVAPPAPRDFSGVTREELYDSGALWFWDAIDHRNEQELRILLEILPEEVLKKARSHGQDNFDGMIHFILEEMPGRREEERLERERFRTFVDRNSPLGMKAELRRTSLTRFEAALVNRSDSVIETAITQGFLNPEQGNIRFFVWRPGETVPIEFWPYTFVLDVIGGESGVFQPGEGFRQEYDLAPVFTRPGTYYIQAMVAYREETSDVVEFEMSGTDILPGKARAWLGAASEALLLRPFRWYHKVRYYGVRLRSTFR